LLPQADYRQVDEGTVPATRKKSRGYAGSGRHHLIRDGPIPVQVKIGVNGARQFNSDTGRTGHGSSSKRASKSTQVDGICEVACFGGMVRSGTPGGPRLSRSQ